MNLNHQLALMCFVLAALAIAYVAICGKHGLIDCLTPRRGATRNAEGN